VGLLQRERGEGMGRGGMGGRREGKGGEREEREKGREGGGGTCSKVLGGVDAPAIRDGVKSEIAGIKFMLQ